MQLYNDLKS